MAQLADLDLDRVDGVDQPATGQRFLLLKAEEPDELRANVQQLLQDLDALFQALDHADMPLTEPVARALNALAKAVGREPAYRAKRPMEYGKPDYGYPPPEKRPARKDADLADIVEAAVAKALAPFEARLGQLESRLGEDEAVVKALIDRQAPVRSAQPRAQDHVAPQRDPWRQVFFGSGVRP
jgi:predicted component of type VI protein secretion system